MKELRVGPGEMSQDRGDETGQGRQPMECERSASYHQGPLSLSPPGKTLGTRVVKLRH